MNFTLAPAELPNSRLKSPMYLSWIEASPSRYLNKLNRLTARAGLGRRTERSRGSVPLEGPGGESQELGARLLPGCWTQTYLCNSPESV